jgi:hypothetical protein
MPSLKMTASAQALLGGSILDASLKAGSTRFLLPITKEIVGERGPDTSTVAKRFHFSDAISITKRYFTSLRNMRS